METRVYMIYLAILAAVALAAFLSRKLLYFMDRDEPEVYDAILNAEELEQHAVEIARKHVVGKRARVSYSLETRMNKNFRFITSVYKNLNEYMNDVKRVTPAAEWLLDNFYIVEEQVKEIRQNLSRQYYYQLPSLKTGTLKGYPRVYAIALELVSHTDGRFDDKLLISFVSAYQSQSLLSSGELWAIPIMIRMALIEHIRHVCEGIMQSQQQWYKAEKLADLLLSHRDKKPEELLAIAKENTKHLEIITPSYGEHLLNRLKKHGLEIVPIIHYLDERLSEQHTTSETITHLEHKEQAARQVSMGNSITSLRFLSTLDWKEIFEGLSQVEQILRQDPDGTYNNMDFSSRDFYRHEVEKISKKYKVSEIQVAKKLIECAKEFEKHFGYFLFRDKKYLLISKLGHEKKQFFTQTFKYLTPIVIITAAIVSALLYYSYAHGTTNVLFLLLAAIVVLIPASDIAVSIVNWVAVHIKPPAFLPKLELKEGIPDEARTVVVMPTLIADEKRAVKLLENLEEYYLANREKNIYFILLGDFKDSSEEVMDSDSRIISAASGKVEELNKKYSTNEDIFFLFHRKRLYNKSQGRWMGWERKRGALYELNEFLLGSKRNSFEFIEGDTRHLKNITYVITIDADTKLTMETAKKLIGTILHPLNRAVIDKKNGIVKEGYGLLQPRISVDIISANASAFSRIFAGKSGIDIYTNAVSDVYQDYFAEGIYTGKGIYEVSIFQIILREAIPENTVLSHDLIEGSYVRTGLVTDIELIDGYPSRYSSHSMRLHRWVRGDWQLIGWLFRKVRNSKGKLVDNPLPVITKWKIFDNLRRSLVAPSEAILFLLSLCIFPGSALVWFLFALLTAVFPIFINIADVIADKYESKLGEKSAYPVIEKMKISLCQSFLTLIFIPHQAYLMLDAIIRSITRVFITRKNMLEWVTAADMEKGLKNTHGGYWERMWVSPVFALFIMVFSIWFSREAIVPAIIMALFWAAAPSFAYWVSRSDKKGYPVVSSEDITELRKISRKTWSFFEDFVSALDNYLPPDNYQENPPNGIAHRTSPTNIGLLLVSIMSARDMGYICTIDMLDRINKTIATIEKLKKWKGHLYNWYDTVTLEVLRPNYISTVDSGNFIGYLMTLKQGLLEYLKRPLIDKSLLEGLKDTALLVNEECNQPALNLDILNSALSSDGLKPSEWNRILALMLEWNVQKRPRWGFKLYKSASSFINEINDNMAWLKVVNDMPELMHIPEIEEVIERVNVSCSLEQYKEILDNCSLLVEELIKNAGKDGIEGLKRLKDSLSFSSNKCGRIVEAFHNIISRVENLIDNMNFLPLYDSRRKLFSIGYNEEEEQMTKSYYDLLASEARQASFIAIARGEIKKEHWFMLNRTLTSVEGHKGLLSWTGTMFEYLMPLLIMNDYENTLLNETYNFVVRCQIDYGRKRKVPWGVSESGYYSFDFRLNYQYKAFGIPALGLKRGLKNDTVIAPYATILALLVSPYEAIKNIIYLKNEGMDSPYGFYEAIDYTPERLKRGTKSSIVKSFMAHHQGMAFLAMNSFINGKIMQERFHRDAVIKSAEILLQEKVPSKVIFAKDYKERIEPFEEAQKEDVEYTTVLGLNNNILPEVHILSNGDYSVMITDNGSGYSKYKDTAVTRWREDSILNNSGMFFYIQDVESGGKWSNTLNPCNVFPGKYKVVFSQDKVSFNRTDGDIDTQTELIISPEDDIEIRRITLTNHGQQAKVIEVTSYSETVLTSQSADVAHPAFSNLFIKTEYMPKYNALLAVRRPREETGKPLWMFHSLTVDSEILGGVQYETDRAKFIGRGYDLCKPSALEPNRPLSNTVGPVLDPILSLRCRIRLQPGQTVKLNFIMGVAESKEKTALVAEKYHETASVERAFELAWTRSQVEMRYLNFRKEEIELYRRMMSQIIYLSPLRRKHENAIKGNRRGQQGLWSYGISGDLPIVLVELSKADEIELVKEVLKAHEYWRIKGLQVDVVLLNEDESSYSQPLFNMLQDLVSVSHARDIRERPGGVFIKQGNTMSEDDKLLLMAAARLVLKGNCGSLSVQVKIKNNVNAFEYKLWREKPKKYPQPESKPLELQYFNGYGGFTEDGKEYVIKLTDGLNTPLPWINVVSNRKFGFFITESGASTTWSENSRENKLTPWSNDPVTDTSGEILYMRDEDTGEIWTITPQPLRDENQYIIKHGFGYSIFEHSCKGIEHELVEFVPVNDTLKICIVRLKNAGSKKRYLSATYFMRPVLGVNVQDTLQHVYTELHNNETITIRNNYNSDFPGRIAFLNCSAEDTYFTGDRREFLGNAGSIKHPEALRLEKLSNVTGAGYDPCACIQAKIEMKPKEQRDIVFLLGEVKSLEEVNHLTSKYKNIKEAYKALEEVKTYWDKLLGSIKVSTPDKTMDLMLNGWLLYQTICCRMWARTAFYQSGGAYGFRDQLQDSMAVLNTVPELAKKQLLFHAAHQFPEGDVLHWWHPGTNKGVRTRFSDDLLWLPFVLIEYLKLTEDFRILDEEALFIEGDVLKEGEDEKYSRPSVSDIKSTIYDHCIRAIEKALKFGHHGIPLMGSGDWNDGMNTVGNKGKGESVWLGWFLYSILSNFIGICRQKNDDNKAERYENIAKEIAKSLEENAWDGNWYRRAYFDNGLPLGSAENTECKIDSLAQTWAVISQAGNPDRIKEALKSLEQYLIRKDEGLILLLTPPFDDGDLRPGYIKGYLPGVRENGGQYTHAAVWVVMAYALLGYGDKAWELYNMLNPINHSNTTYEAVRYKAEPYVMAADIYAVHPHVGRGGWTWYTGAAGWMYNVALQYILGFNKRGGKLLINPCIPREWKDFYINYNYKSTIYNIAVSNPNKVTKGVSQLKFDGKALQDNEILLVDDGAEHNIEVIMG
ncbi:MAG: GH36-type glycosyl hydrolase domain-containing protein [Caulobacteraceae bacterium]